MLLIVLCSRAAAIDPVAWAPLMSQASPWPPDSFTNAPRPSKNERGWASSLGTHNARTTPPSATISRNSLNEEPAKMWDRSRISSPKRRSGLSVPKRSMASAWERRGKGGPLTCQSVNS